MFLLKHLPVKKINNGQLFSFLQLRYICVQVRESVFVHMCMRHLVISVFCSDRSYLRDDGLNPAPDFSDSETDDDETDGDESDDESDDDDDDDDDPMIHNKTAKNHTSERTIVSWTVIFF